MKKQTRRKFSSSFKAEVAVEAVKNQSTLAELAVKFEATLPIEDNCCSKDQASAKPICRQEGLVGHSKEEINNDYKVKQIKP